MAADTLLWILGATFVDSLAGVFGLLSFLFHEQTLRWLVILLFALSAGTLIGATLFQIGPVSIRQVGPEATVFYLLFGVLVFLYIEGFVPKIMERVAADALHCLLDGMIVACAFLTGQNLGLGIMLLFLLHEIPRHFNIFVMNVYDYQKKQSEYSYSAEFATIVGGALGFYLFQQYPDLLLGALPFAAGGLVFVACWDVIPTFPKMEGIAKALVLFLAALGVLVMKVAYLPAQI